MVGLLNKVNLTFVIFVAVNSFDSLWEGTTTSRTLGSTHHSLTIALSASHRAPVTLLSFPSYSGQENVLQSRELDLSSIIQPWYARAA